jgi:hypothetical protein
LEIHEGIDATIDATRVKKDEITSAPIANRR